MTKHPRLFFTVVTIVAFLAPAANASALIAANHSETMLIGD
jgi:hypothetical protein